METEVNDFEAILRASLLKTNEAFERADADLHQVVTEASAALEKVTEGRASLELEPFEESEKGITYVLNARWNSSSTKFLQGFHVPSGGYPIICPPFEFDRAQGLVVKEGTPKAHLKDKVALKKHFAEMVINPDSSLVTYVAFQLRRKTDEPDVIEF